MTVFAGRESVIENAGQIFRGDAHAVVSGGYLNATISTRNAHCQPLVVAAGFVAGVLRVADQINQDLKHFVPFDNDLGHLRIVFAG